MSDDPTGSREWFMRYGTVADPAAAADKWKAWVVHPRGRRERAKYCKLLELSVGVTRSTVSHYLKGRQSKLHPETIEALNVVTTALGYEPPKEPGAAVPTPRVRGSRHIVVFADLRNVPSPRYHMEVIRGVVREGARRNFEVIVHDLDHKSRDSAIEVARVVRNTRADGLVWLRMTPTQELIERSGMLPSVIVHGRIRAYAPPVLAHVVPRQDEIPRDVASWARALGSIGRVAVATLPEEPEGCGASIRNERVALIQQGLRLAHCEPVVVHVTDLSGCAAWDVVTQAADAIGYVCLSDELAIAVEHLLRARNGRSHGPRRVLGFDDSSLAERYGICSMGQDLGAIGDAVCNAFGEWFSQRAPGTSPATMPATLELAVELTVR